MKACVNSLPRLISWQIEFPLLLSLLSIISNAFSLTQLPEVNFLLRRAIPTNLAVAQTLATKIEDDLILAGKIKKDPNRSKGNSFPKMSTLGTTNSMVQKLANELLALKKQISQGSFAAPYKDIPRRSYPNPTTNYTAKNQSKYPPSPERFSVEPPP